MWPDFSDDDAAILHPRLLSEMQDTFGRSLQHGEAVRLAKLVRKFGRREIGLRLQSYREAVSDGSGTPVTSSVWLRRHGAFWLVQHVDHILEPPT